MALGRVSIALVMVMTLGAPLVVPSAAMGVVATGGCTSEISSLPSSDERLALMAMCLSPHHWVRVFAESVFSEVDPLRRLALAKDFRIKGMKEALALAAEDSAQSQDFLDYVKVTYPRELFPHVASAAAAAGISEKSRMDFMTGDFQRALDQDKAMRLIEADRRRAVAASDREFVRRVADSNSGVSVRQAASRAIVGSDADVVEFFAGSWAAASKRQR